MNAKYMELALTEAKKAALEGEVPIGAVLVKNEKQPHEKGVFKWNQPKYL